MRATSSTHRGPGRGLLLVVLAAFAIAVAAIALVLLRGDRQASFPSGSPEAAYQAYLTAWADGDRDATWDALSSSVRASWPKQEYLDAAAMKYSSPDDAAISIDRSTVNGDRATLRVTIERVYRNGLQSSRSRSSFDVRLVREEGAWRIDQRLMGPSEGWW